VSALDEASTASMIYRWQMFFQGLSNLKYWVPGVAPGGAVLLLLLLGALSMSAAGPRGGTGCLRLPRLWPVSSGKTAVCPRLRCFVIAARCVAVTVRVCMCRLAISSMCCRAMAWTLAEIWGVGATGAAAAAAAAGARAEKPPNGTARLLEAP